MGHDMTIRIQRILLPTDFSVLSATATSYACELATKFDADLHLLHALDSGGDRSCPAVYPPAVDGDRAIDGGAAVREDGYLHSKEMPFERFVASRMNRLGPVQSVNPEITDDLAKIVDYGLS